MALRNEMLFQPFVIHNWAVQVEMSECLNTPLSKVNVLCSQQKCLQNDHCDISYSLIYCRFHNSNMFNCSIFLQELILLNLDSELDLFLFKIILKE